VVDVLVNKPSVVPYTRSVFTCGISLGCYGSYTINATSFAEKKKNGFYKNIKLLNERTQRLNERLERKMMVGKTLASESGVYFDS